MSDDKPGKVEQRAYEIWDREGRPHGKALEHWHQAVAEIAREEKKATKAKVTGAKKKTAKAKKAAAKPAATARTAGAKSPAKPKKAATKKKG
jgi:hypothetical protein